jgi:DNA-binding Lrp family transcriptional regulator
MLQVAQSATPVTLSRREVDVLYALDFNARASDTEIAKSVGGATTPEDVGETITTLVQKGVIAGFHPVLNVPMLGYMYGRVLITLHNCTLENEEDIVDYLINHPRVFWTFRTQGSYDLLFMAWTKSSREFLEFIQVFESRFGKFVKRKMESIVTDLTYLRSRYLNGGSDRDELHVHETPNRISLDKLDRRILQLMSINARFTADELALNLKEPKKTIEQRVAKLEKNGLILGYRPLVNHRLIGYTWYKVWLHVNMTSRKAFAALMSDIKGSPITVWVAEGIGLPADIEIEVMVSSNSELYEFINRLRFTYPAMIEDYSTFVFLETLKELYFPFH